MRIISNSNGFRFAKPLCGVALAAASLPNAIHAQDGASLALEEIIVTAERRERSLQDVPVAVTALSGDTILNVNLNSVQDLRYVAPSLTFREGGGPRGEGFNVRGVGTQSFSDGVEQSVGIVVDGVVMGATGIGNNALADIERVEILRGPQGTLFGKNASAGVISVVTRKPELGTWEAKANLRYGEHNDRNLQGVINVPFGDTSALRLSAYSTHQDGFITNLVTGQDNINEKDEYGFRGKWRWQPSDRFELTVVADYALRDHDCCVSTPRSAGVGANPYAPYWAEYGVEPAPNLHYVTLDGHPSNGKVAHQYLRDRGISGEMNIRFGEYTLTSITAYRNWNQSNLRDSDTITIDVANVNTAEAEQTQFTQELRLTSPAGERLEFVAGLFFFDSTFDNVAAQGGSLSTAIAPTGNRFLRQYDNEMTNKSYAAFASGTYAVTDDLRLIVGARYTHDEIEMDLYSFYDPNYLGLTYSGWPGQTFPLRLRNSAKEEDVSWKIGLQYDFSPAVMSYATVSTGYKGPTFYASLDSSPEKSSTPVAPELSTNYEIGLKSQWWDDRLLLNVALFLTTFEDFQTTLRMNVNGLPTSTLANAGELRTRGVETEVVARVHDTLTLSAAVSYIDATFTDFKNAPCYTNQPVSTDPRTGCAVVDGVSQTDATGNRVGGQSDWYVNVAANWRMPIGASYEVSAYANYYWRSAFNFSSVGDPNLEHEAYGILNANVGFGDVDGRWKVGLYAKNLLDKQFAPLLGRQLTNDPGHATVQWLSTDTFRTVGAFADFRF